MPVIEQRVKFQDRVSYLVIVNHLTAKNEEDGSLKVVEKAAEDIKEDIKEVLMYAPYYELQSKTLQTIKEELTEASTQDPWLIAIYREASNCVGEIQSTS